MVKYDGTVRNSQGSIAQFLYGEDGMCGEAIEDLRIESIRLNDSEIKKKFSYEPNETTLKNILNPVTLQNVVRDSTVKDLVQQECNQIIEDRDTLRKVLFKTGEDQTHLPLNI